MTLNEAALAKAFEAYWDAQPPGTEAGLRAAIAAYLDETKLPAALERQADNMAFVVNHMSMPDHWNDKLIRELEEDRDALQTQETE